MYSTHKPFWHIIHHPNRWAELAAFHIVSTALQAMIHRKVAHLVLPGGTSIRPVLEVMLDLPLLWQDCHFYLTDERCLPRDHPDRNDQIFTFLLDQQPRLQPKQIHTIAAELGPQEGADQLRRQLFSVPPFDLVVLGLGEDGHTASLFPEDREALESTDSAVAVFNAPKAPPERVSLGLRRLKGARERMVIAKGSSKQPIIERIRQKESFPITLTEPHHWFVDYAAFPLS